MPETITFETMKDWGEIGKDIPHIGALESGYAHCPCCTKITDIPEDLDRPGPWCDYVRGFTKDVEPKGLVEAAYTFECRHCRNVFQSHVSSEQVEATYRHIAGFHDQINPRT